MNNLKLIRKEMGYTQTEIADFLEMEQTYYSRIELNKHTLQIDRYMKLAVFYNVTIDYLCGLIDTPRTLTGISWADNVYIKKRAGK